MSELVYLDYLSTTPVDPVVAEAMGRCLTMDGTFGNPASRSHRFGWEAEMAVETARQQLASLINADVECSDGFIHVIDTVLIPAPKRQTLISTAESAGSFSTLLAAVSKFPFMAKDWYDRASQCFYRIEM